MSRLTLWFGDQDTYEGIDEDSGSEVVALTEEGAELVAAGTTLKKFTEEEAEKYILGRVSVDTLLEYFLEGHPDFFGDPEPTKTMRVTLDVTYPESEGTPDQWDWRGITGSDVRVVPVVEPKKEDADGDEKEG